MYMYVLKDIAKYTFHMVQGKQYPTFHLLKQKWAKMWIGNQSKKERMKEGYNYNNRNLLRKYEKKGLESLLKFHENFLQPGFPLLIAKDMQVQIGKYTVQIPIDLVRQVNHGTIELVQWSIDKPSNTFLLNQNLSLTAQAYAFKAVGDYSPQLRVYSFDKGTFAATVRNEKHFKVFEQIVKQVAKQIEDEVFYPRYQSVCADCPYRQRCQEGLVSHN